MVSIMSHKIKEIRAKENLFIAATFFDGTVKEYDVKNLFPLFPQLKKLESDKVLFKNIKVDAGGYGISWDDELDLDAETIWEEGQTLEEQKMSPVLELAQKLVEARENAGLTQRQLSERIGIYQADISKIERGLANPSVSTLQRLAEGMGMHLNISFDK